LLGEAKNRPKHAPPKDQPPAPSPTPLPMSPALPYPAHESLALSRCAKAKGTRPDRQEARMHDRDSPECRPHVNGDGISAGEEGCRLTTAAPRSLVIPVPTTAQRARQAPSHTPHSSQQARATTATAWELPGHWTTGHGPHVDHTADRSPQSPQWQWQWHEGSGDHPEQRAARFQFQCSSSSSSGSGSSSAEVPVPVPGAVALICG
jgi:hypothetical protein